MIFRPTFPVRSERLALRPLEPGDAEALHSYRSLPRVCRFVPFEPMDVRTIESNIGGGWSRRAIEREGEALILGVELAPSGELAGDVMLRWLSETHRCGEIGYVFHPRFEGQGYATEAGRLLLRLAFEEMGLHRVVARVDARNSASARVLLRLGMRPEAHLLENEWFKGEWSDELDFAILGREWRGLAGEGLREAPPG